MDGPLTCEQLRNIRPMIIDMETKKLVNDITDVIIRDIISESNRHCNSPRTVTPGMLYKHKADVSRGIRKGIDYQSPMGQLVTTKRGELFNMIINNLKEKFPDMKFMPDPVYTYLLCDWS